MIRGDSSADRPRPDARRARRALVATGLGSGYSPIAPGTAGSAVGLLLFWPLARLPARLAGRGHGRASSRPASRPPRTWPRSLGIEDPGSWW